MKLFVLGLVTLTLLLYLNSSNNENANRVASDKPSVASSHKKLKNFNLLLTQISDTKPTITNFDVRIENLRTEFKLLADLKDKIDKNVIRQQKLTEMIQNPENIFLAQKTLENLDWTIDNFKEDQAEARIYSIELLKAKLAQGDEEALITTANKLAFDLANDPTKWIKGREHDLRDLVGAWIEIKGRKEILNNPEALFSTFKYSPALRPIFSKTVVSYLYQSAFDEEIDKALENYWSNDYLAGLKI